MMGKNFLHNVKSFHIILISTCLSLLFLPVYVRYTCPKQVIGTKLFQTSVFICLEHHCIHLCGYRKLWKYRCIFIFAIAIFVFRFFWIFCLFQWVFIGLLRLSMKNKKYKQRKEIYDLMQSRYTRFLLHFPLSCNCP